MTGLVLAASLFSAAWLEESWLGRAWALAHLGHPPAPALRAPGNTLASTPLLRWTVALPGLPRPVAAPVEPASPVVNGGEIYVGYSGAHALLVLGRRDGSLVDSLEARAPVASAPVFVTADQLVFADAAGYTAAWSRSPGGPWKRLWEHYSGAPILSSPRVVDGVVYIANVDELVYALDLQSGELRWRHQHKLDAARTAELELFGAPAPAVAGDSVYAGFSDGFLVALDRATGSPQWQAQVGEGTYPDLIAAPVPLPQGGVLVGGYSKPLMRLDPATRTPAWRLDVGSATAALLEGEIAYQPGADGQLRAIDTRTGEQKWAWDSGSSGPLLTPQSTAQGLLVASTDASIYLIDPASGRQTWSLDGGALNADNLGGVTLTGFAASPGLAGDEIYAVSNGGRLYALRGRPPAAGANPLPWVSQP
ncbi:MAG: PQQ-binding-like beta-propeller repeat protein [Deltaproteobacteria bacterium]|nr:PQQ-binding-like beta-propeller repeat protein [Deltaproteobacteria bacterium]